MDPVKAKMKFPMPIKRISFWLVLALGIHFCCCCAGEDASGALWRAIQHGDGHNAQNLAHRYFDPNYSRNGIHLIHLATLRNWPQLVRLLCRRGADPDAEHSEGYTSLQLAVMYKLQEVVEVLVEEGADVNKGATRTPLLEAIVVDCLGCVRALNTPNLNVDLGDGTGRAPLTYAAEIGHLGVVQWLIEDKNADVNTADNQGFTPLMQAVISDSIILVHYLLFSGADANSKWRYGGTPLNIGVELEKNTVLDLICATDLGAVQSEEHGLTGVELILRSGHLDWIEMMESCYQGENATSGEGTVTHTPY